ncbi:unnamed protein product [Caenorhabditis angaria]|uniref:Uncharacterized protein n=1 Tax=Caenorhabditis angaria TaxID=860376 RepID=A0A9P1I7E3_9PELO|nr:unnamed protein product [Caenorhabditis angaria]
MSLIPWQIVKYFENEKNVKYNMLELSLGDLKSRANNSKALTENLDKLEKLARLQVDILEHLPIGFIVNSIKEMSNLADIPSLLPQFPKQPSKNIIDAYINSTDLRDSNLSEDEKLENFKEVSTNIAIVLKTLDFWKNEVETCIKGIAGFKKSHQKYLNEVQMSKLEVMENLAENSLAQIIEKIEMKKCEAEAEAEIKTETEPEIDYGFHRFFEELKNDEKFIGINENEKIEAIKDIWNKTDETIRRIFQKDIKSVDELVPNSILKSKPDKALKRKQSVQFAQIPSSSPKRSRKSSAETNPIDENSLQDSTSPNCE